IPCHSLVNTLSLHDALPIYHVRTPTLPAPPHPPTGRTLPGKKKRPQPRRRAQTPLPRHVRAHSGSVLSQPEDVHSQPGLDQSIPRDRKSTRLNSSHVSISYAVICSKKNSQ